ncbi:testis-expressed protein 48 [Mastomys coucha]|uniref:testis-expressed protein 48 n=1 Tax=Mastomys coucha TaxID=35658 RepID=UPI0012616EB8|nr:testis-expressed protein 48 [Mastomys coucha]XP_031233509.1 testis-expressed protein 48 [Mastomys coucha]
MAAHQTLASKIFSLCCWYCEEPVVESSKVPSQESQTPTYNLLKTEKNEVCEPNLKQATAQTFSGQEKNISLTGSDFEELTAYNIQTGYPKKNLNRYYQEHWAVRQPCLLGRP